MILRQLDNHMQSNEFGLSHLYTNELKMDQKSKWVSYKYKTLRRKHREINLQVIGLVNGFLNVTPKHK